MVARVIQTFINVCTDCPHCQYYSAGMYECMITLERLPDRKDHVGDRCPLPFAGPPVQVANNALTKENANAE